MAGTAQAIQQHLDRVNMLRGARLANEGLARRVAAVKRYQHARFSRDYAGLIASTRYGAAAGFFLEDLYGPMEFGDRDAQFERVIPAMGKLLPDEVMHTVVQLAELHALSEDLDQQMALALDADDVEAGSYRAAWLSVGRREDRERQVSLLIAIGDALDRHTRHAWLRTTLKLMRGPARAAGLSQLQSFLERGFAAFAAMGNAQEFLAIIAANERQQILDMFSVAEK
jgi:hypothetical protein